MLNPSREAEACLTMSSRELWEMFLTEADYRQVFVLGGKGGPLALQEILRA